jgi:heterodisulfide reductase subunit A-like polyferredoxin
MVNLRSNQSGLNSPSRKSRIRTAALAAARENHLIQILCKVWPAAPTKLHAHQCPSIARSEKNEVSINIKSMQKTRVLILGGGFGGLYAALEFEKRDRAP